MGYAAVARASKKSEYLTTDAKGQQRVFRTKIEAQAYIARNGGKGSVQERELASA